jgi:putative RecB family exonuclease
MSKQTAVQKFNKDLHISNNQIFNYLTCSLKYRFHYVEKRPPERVSISLPFGGAIHAAIEMYYRAIQNNNQIEAVEKLCERFETCLKLDLDQKDILVIFKKDIPDHKAAVDMGKALLKVFHENIAAYAAEDIVAVEHPLKATLFTEDGNPTDFKLVGIVDLILRDKSGEIVVVDNKTASKAMGQEMANLDNQMTAYAYLLAANKFVFPTAPVKCRFDLLRKLKTPKLEHVFTTRTAAHRKRFAKLATAVLAGIDAGVFIPQPSWMCADCAYADACKSC